MPVYEGYTTPEGAFSGTITWARSTSATTTTAT